MSTVTTKVGTFVWHEHVSTDPKQAQDLYAQLLGWEYEVKELAYNGLHHVPNWLMGPSLASLEVIASAALVRSSSRLVAKISRVT